MLDAARHLVPLGSPKLVPHNGRAYLASQEDMTATARRVAAAMTGPGTASAATLLLGETEELTRKCTLDPARDLGVGSRHLPETKGTAYDQHKELRDRCEHAILHGRYRTASAASRPRGVSRLRAAETARERLEHELDIIAQTGMAAYFLTVADIADRIRHAGIRCAVRGSGAGSFVNHLLGISAIDPIEHDLLMERFLSPVRNTLPDIDLDVESARRLDAYRIIFDRYGKERTACVCMMETYRARSAIRDVAAAMSLPPDEIGAIAKSFPHIRAKHITAALTELPELRRSRLDSTQITTIFSIAQQLDGLPRHVAMHPCGVLLSDKTLLDRTAVQESGEGFPLSQLDKDDAEIAGVIKLDVLGVRMQSAMAHALTEIERTENERIDIDAMPRDDPATYAMIQRSETLGCFQIESPGQRELVKKLAPRDIADLIVDISLFRPGPVNSDMIGPFLRTRHGLAEPRYPHEKLEKALKETGGVVVFHEQVLRVIDAMTGCGLAEADLVRRHLSTEGGPDRTAPWFRAQALASGFDPVTVERVWQVVAAFGGFGFCKAHAAAFAIPVYQSAWLRRHHPAAFYAGVLTHEPGMYPKRVIIADARLSGVQILPVDINASSGDWAVVSRGGDPPYPPMSARPGLIAKTATVSGPPARTNVPREDDAPPYPPMSARPGLIAKTATVSGPPARTNVPREDDPPYFPMSVRGDTVPSEDTPDPDGPYPPTKENPSSRTTAASSSPPNSPLGVRPADGSSRPRSMTSFQRSEPPADGTGRPRFMTSFQRPGSPASAPARAGSTSGGSPPSVMSADPAADDSPPGQSRAGRSAARRFLESSGPLQALRFPGRSCLPGGRPPVPPDVSAGRPDRKNRDRIRPARTDGDLRAAASPQAIRCSLREVKGISDAEITRIVAGQPYTGLRDFWNRAGASRPVTERLVLIGAFDSLYTSAPNFAESPNAPAANTTSAGVRSGGSAGVRPGGCGSEPTIVGSLPQPPGILAGKMSANCRVAPHSPAAPSSLASSPSPTVASSVVSSPSPTALSSSASSPSQVSPEPLWLSAPTPDISDMPGRRLAPGHRAPALPRPSRRDLLARVGVLARQSAPARHGSPAALDLFADVSAEAADGMADLVPAGELRDLDLTERVVAELEILGFELSQHVLHFYADLLAGLGVVRSAELADRENGEMILVAGAKVATQTPAVRSGQRIIFASLDDAAGLVDLAFFESVQDRCAARLFASWLLLVRGRVRRAGAGPMAVTVNATECWDLPALEEIREAGGMAAVRAAMAAGDAGPGTHLVRLPDPGTSPNSADPAAPTPLTP